MQERDQQNCFSNILLYHAVTKQLLVGTFPLFHFLAKLISGYGCLISKLALWSY